MISNLKAVGMLLSMVLLVCVASGCVSYSRESGIQNTWRSSATPGFVEGKTTSGEVLDALGPPSQVIALDGETMFYYLHEQIQGTGAIFILYNRLNERTSFDRAIFFFDENNVLKEYVFSKEAID